MDSQVFIEEKMQFLICDKKVNFKEKKFQIPEEYPNFKEIQFEATYKTSDLERLILKIGNEKCKEKFIHQAKDEVSIQWVWDPKGRIGYHSMKIFDDKNNELVSKQIYLTPKKIDFDNYERMVSDIKRISYKLMYDFFKDSFEFITEEYIDESQDIGELYTKIKEVIKKLELILQEISESPHKKIITIYNENFIFNSKKADANTFKRIFRHPKYLSDFSSKNDPKIIPLKIEEPKKICDFDVSENRLIRHFLDQILNEKINLIIEIARNEVNKEKENYFKSNEKKLEKLGNVIKLCKEYQKKIKFWILNYEFLHAGKLRTVKTGSMVLQREKNYREFYKLYLDFMKKHSLIFSSNDFYHTIKSIDEIYEVWCVLTVISIVRKLGFNIVEENMFDRENIKFTFRLKKGNNPIIKLKNEKYIIEFFYEKEYTETQRKNKGYGSRGENQKPDIALEIYKLDENIKIPKILIFDAKYRKYVGEIINKMAAYRHDIASEKYSVVLKAYALWIDNTLHHEKTGGIKFLPSESKKEIERIIKESLVCLSSID